MRSEPPSSPFVSAKEFRPAPSKLNCHLMVVTADGDTLEGITAMRWITDREGGRKVESTPNLPPAVLEGLQSHSGTEARLEACLECLELDNRLTTSLWWGAADRCVLLVQEASVAILRDHGLTARQAEVMHWVCEGKTNPEISAILGVTVHTVNRHMEQVRRKLQVENRQQAVRMVAHLNVVKKNR